MERLDGAHRRCARQSLAMLTAGHDMRQHLQVMDIALGRIALLEDIAGNREWIQTAQEQAHRLMLEAQRLAENADLKLEKMTARATVFPIQHALRQIDADWRVFAASKGLCLEVPRSNAIVKSDLRLLSVILDNVVANAVHYTPSGEVCVDCESSGDFLLVSVRNSGPGISAEALSRVFATAAATVRSGGGMGVGVKIVQRSAELLGHEISFATTLDRGLLFTLRVPLAI